jgi:chromosome segregation ATPase
MNARFAEYEKQLKERQEECEYLLARKNAHATEFIERTAEIRESYEKQLAHKEDTISFLKELTEKLQHDLDKAESVSSDYLHRIDTKNQQLLDAYTEIRKLNNEVMKMANSNADDIKGMIDRFFRLTDAHTEEVKALTQK